MKPTKKLRKLKTKALKDLSDNPSPVTPQKHKNNPQQLRIPRPQGVTGLMKEYKQSNNQGQLRLAKKLMIQHWANNNFTISQIPYTLPELANYLEIGIKEIIKETSKPILTWLQNGTGYEDWRALSAQAFFWGHQDRALAMAQHKVFEDGQRNKETGEIQYTPFVSDFATKSIGQINQTTRTLMDIIKMMKPDPKPKELEKDLKSEPDASQASTESGKYIGTTEAVKLLEAKPTPIDNPEMIKGLLAEHAPEPLPEITATKQQGITADGLNPRVPKKKKSFSDKIANSPSTTEVIIA